MLMIAITNLNRGIIFDSEMIPQTSRACKGVKGVVGSKLRKSEEVVDVRVLTDEELELIESKQNR